VSAVLATVGACSKALYMMGPPGQLGDGAVVAWGDDTPVTSVAISIEDSLLPIHCGDLSPQGSRALTATVADVKGHTCRVCTSSGLCRNFAPKRVPPAVPVIMRWSRGAMIDFRGPS